MVDERKMENRVIAHFDIDCFYAQSEELKCPSLRGRPIGVTQKFLVVTCNYVARSLGVPKMLSIAEAKRKLPTLVLINGEDLTPYRADSKRIGAVLRRFGTVERHGLDEGAVDITAQVEARLQSGPPTLSFSGHVLGLATSLRTGNGPLSDTFFNFESLQLNLENLPLVDVSLLVGSQIVADIRRAIEKETGFQCSCGVAQNKMLAKLSSSLNKPNMQTCLLQGAVAEFLAPMAVRRIPGVGQQTHDLLSGMNVETIADLEKVPLKQLSQRLGDRVAILLSNAARGHDPSQVQDKGPPKSISVEDSFRNCPTMQHAAEILRVLAPDLIRRLDEDREETGRRPKSFTVKWRVQGPKWYFTSMSTQMPLELLSPSATVEKRAFLVVDVATKLLLRGLQEPFNLAVLNIGATNFESASSSRGILDMRSFFQGKTESPDKELKVTSKRDARANRESFKAVAKKSWDVLSEVQFRDSYHLSSSSEDEEVDDLVDHLRLSGRRSSRQRDDRQKDIQKLPHEADGAVPLSRKLFAVHPSAGVPAEQGGTVVNTSRPGMKDLMNTNFGNSSRSIYTSESKLNLFETPAEMSIMKTSRLGYHCGSFTEGCGSEPVHICDHCGEIAGDTVNARQEHADYHFASSLAKRERSPLPQSPKSSRVVYIAKRERVVHSDPPLKKSKSRSGTLDGFLVRHP